MDQPEKFNPYTFLARIKDGNLDENRTMLSDQFRASDLAEIVKTLMVAVEILSEKVKGRE